MHSSPSTPVYDHTKWQRFNWHKPENNRRYQAELKQNLFGEWVLVRFWGSMHRRGGQQIETTYDDYNQACRQIEAVNTQRLKRGYVEGVNHDPNNQ